MKFIMSLYGPYLGAGVTVNHISPDWRELRVSMKLRWYNKNIVGTHFGGSLYSMVDPHLMLLLMQSLGSDYIIWDKAAEIEFKRPGRGTVTSTVIITEEDLARIRQKTAGGEKYLPVFPVRIVDADNKIVAKVKKTLYISRKKTAPATTEGRKNH